MFLILLSRLYSPDSFMNDVPKILNTIENMNFDLLRENSLQPSPECFDIYLAK